MNAIAGVDGVPGGWVVVLLRGRAPRWTVRWAVVTGAAEVVDLTAECDAVGVDIPLALPVDGTPRRCDALCAVRLGRARSSVFPAPPREVLLEPTHEAAVRRARELTGRGISIQSYNIRRQILGWAAVDPLPDNVVEVHPELSVRGLAPGTEFASKKTARGAGQRIGALTRWVDPARALADLPEGARLDDCLDALAGTWSAARWAAGTADVLGGETGARGRVMRIAV
jgi:predicted RNase H-like nuclease